MQLSLVTATYNSKARTLANIELLDRYLRDHFSHYEIILVEDGSRKEERVTTAELPKSVHFLRHSSNKGKGAAIKLGMTHASGECVIFTDCDLPYELAAIPYAYDKITGDGIHFIAGDRSHLYSDNKGKIKLLRHILTFCFNSFAHLMTGGVHDTQCGFKAFSADLCRAIFPQIRVKRFAFDVEIFHLVYHGKVPYLLIPVILRNNDGSTVRVVRDSLSMLVDLLGIFRRYTRAKYDYATITKLATSRYWTAKGKTELELRRRRK